MSTKAPKAHLPVMPRNDHETGATVDLAIDFPYEGISVTRGADRELRIRRRPGLLPEGRPVRGQHAQLIVDDEADTVQETEQVSQPLPEGMSMKRAKRLARAERKARRG